ncbi:putative lipase [Porphyridium purpureum]|uniref:Putative lipase n=1 Tax=Porphyridium purpureum TaxID=35688 RepID=A0A5J4Z370_PORPP|nr:putative lipase [Porphyridium purpureum]|eukprot:POR8045..scf295_1
MWDSRLSRCSARVVFHCPGSTNELLQLSRRIGRTGSISNLQSGALDATNSSRISLEWYGPLFVLVCKPVITSASVAKGACPVCADKDRPAAPQPKRGQCAVGQSTLRASVQGYRLYSRLQVRRSLSNGPSQHKRAAMDMPIGLDAATEHMASKTHLLVLVHGLKGTPEDLGFFQKIIEDDEVRSQRGIMVHATRVNERKTTDGVAAGARRVADDIRRITALPVARSLQRISVVGFSLGGLYARYAVALLYDHETNTVAGLQPNIIMAVASPHLGVRSFGWLRFCPTPLLWIVRLLFGLTGQQMVLLDKANDQGEPLLAEMCRDTTLPFLTSLRAFKRRVLYANTANDFMVPFGTATLQPHLQQLRVQPEFVPPRNATIIEDRHVDGCRIWYEHEVSSEELPYLTNVEMDVSSRALVIPDRHVASFRIRPEPAEVLVKRMSKAVRRVDGSIATADIVTGAATEVDEKGIETNLRDRLNLAATSPKPMTGIPVSLEEFMAARLRAVGWRTVCVDFPVPLPIAHNRIVAMARHPVEGWINSPGQRAVQHMAKELLVDLQDTLE